jgi:type IV pilus assembly protein PilY1
MEPIVKTSTHNASLESRAAGRGALFSSAIFLLLLLLALSPLAAKAQFTISQTPLNTGGGAAANLLYIHDDSGSMYWSYMMNPGATHTTISRTRPDQNKIYYDPNMTYTPPVDADGNSLGNSDFNAAWFDGYDLAGRNGSGNYCTDGSKPVRRRVDLATQYAPTSGYGCYYSSSSSGGEFLSVTPGAAYYYNSSGVKVAISADPAQRQNFANWYSYYRTRNYTARAGISHAFSDLDGKIRVGWGSINNSTINGVKPFTGQHKKDFYNWLFSKDTNTGTGPSGMTPLSAGLNRAGQYYANSDLPWRDDPTNAQSGLSGASCRKSFTILMTDGYSNDVVATGNTDGASTSFMPPGKPGTTVSALNTGPFSDSQANTLADVAWRYWSRDLQGDDANNMVPGTTRDPAWWQHMTTYTIGLGVTGSVSKTTAFHNADNNIDQTWPWINGLGGDNEDPSKIDDLLHAAVNGHGDFFAAQNPQEFADGMASIINSIQTSAAAISKLARSNSGGKNKDRVDDNTLAYDVKNDPGWFGRVSAYRVGICTKAEITANSNGCSPEKQLKYTPQWEASELIKAAITPPTGSHAVRNILSAKWDATNPAKTTSGIKFEWASLDPSQQAAMVSPLSPNDPKPQLNAPNGPDILNYVRGDTSREGNDASKDFRPRDGNFLGDIFSDLVYYGPSVSDGYDRFPDVSQADQEKYKNWKNDPVYKSTPGMLYVGANDGMLHAFNGATGEEVVAYVPASVIPKLYKLADPDYTHEFYVDATPFVAEAQIGGEWKNVLVGAAGVTSPIGVSTTGAGERSYFAIDVTNPNASKVLWEFTDPELGYNSAGRATISRLKGGQWVAIFGNGYNSKSHRAQLFVVDIGNGTLLRRLDTGVGDAPNPNGLSAPRAFDGDPEGANLGEDDQDGAINLVYAGDMHGNLWRFDLSDPNPASWTTTKLLVAKGPAPDNRLQPITAPPEVVRLRGDRGVTGIMVYVGTGKFFAPDDLTDNSTQSLYGVLDTVAPVVPLPYSRSNGLFEQSIGASTGVGGAANTSDLEFSYSTYGGFFLDLTGERERVLSPVEVLYNSRSRGSIELNTFMPTGNACTGGVGGRTAELDRLYGKKSDKPLLFSEENIIMTGGSLTHFGGGGGDPAGGGMGSSCFGTDCVTTLPQESLCGGVYTEEKDGEEVQGIVPCGKKGRKSWRQLR